MRELRIDRRPLNRGRKLALATAATAVLGVALAAAGELRLRQLAGRESPDGRAPHQVGPGPTARSLRPGLGWVHRPVEARRASEGTNRWGFRDDEPAVPKPAGTFRIVVLGDSATFGADAGPARATFPGRLERLLAAEDPAELRVDVVNAGIEGHGAVQVEAALRHLVAPRLEPDLVVYAFYPNDAQDAVYADFQHPDVPPACHRADEPPGAAFLDRRRPGDRLRFWLRARSALVGELRERAARLRYGAGARVRPPHRSTCSDWGLFTEAVGAMAATASRITPEHAPLVVFRVPLLRKIGGEPDPKVAFLEAMAARRDDLVWLDPEPALLARLPGEGLAPADLAAGPGDDHPGPHGHRVLGDALHDGLLDAGLLPPR